MGEAGIGQPHQQVIVVGHQAVGNDVGDWCEMLTHPLQEKDVVGALEENGLPISPPIGEVIVLAWREVERASRHG